MGVDKRIYPNGFRSTPGNTIGIGNPTIPIGKSRGDIGSHRKMEKYNHSVQDRKLRQVL